MAADHKSGVISDPVVWKKNGFKSLLVLIDVAIDRASSDQARDLARVVRVNLVDFDERPPGEVTDAMIDGTAKALDGVAQRITKDGFIRRDRLDAIILRSDQEIFAAAAAALLLAGLVTIFLARTIVRPIGRAARIAEAIAGGDFGATIERPRGNSETASLIRTLAVMRDSDQIPPDRRRTEPGQPSFGVGPCACCRRAAESAKQDRLFQIAC